MTSSIFIDPLAHVWAIRWMLANLLVTGTPGLASSRVLAVPKAACVAI